MGRGSDGLIRRRGGGRRQGRRVRAWARPGGGWGGVGWGVGLRGGRCGTVGQSGLGSQRPWTGPGSAPLCPPDVRRPAGGQGARGCVGVHYGPSGGLEVLSGQYTSLRVYNTCVCGVCCCCKRVTIAHHPTLNVRTNLRKFFCICCKILLYLWLTLQLNPCLSGDTTHLHRPRGPIAMIAAVGGQD